MGLMPATDQDLYFMAQADAAEADRWARLTQAERDTETAQRNSDLKKTGAVVVGIGVGIVFAPKAAAAAAFYGLGRIATYVFVGTTTSQISDAAFQATLVVLGEQQSINIEQNLLATALGGLFTAAPALAQATLQGVKKVGHRFFAVFSNRGKQVEAELASAEVAALLKGASQADDAASATAGKSPTNPAGKSEPCPPCPQSPASPQAKGAAAEQRVADELGIQRNAGPGRETVPGSGPGGIRVPDLPPSITIEKLGTVVEVKDLSGTLKTTKQLRDLLNYAQSNGATLTIYTNANLPQSGWLARNIKTQHILIKPIP